MSPQVTRFFSFIGHDSDKPGHLINWSKLFFGLDLDLAEIVKKQRILAVTVLL